MATNNEIEFKQLLSEEQYSQLKNDHFKHTPAFTQTNYYIDTPDFTLKHHLCALRIRKKHNTLEMTLKVPAKVGLLEYNFETNVQPHIGEQLHPSALPQDITEELESINANIHQLEILGSLTTTRMEVAKGDNLLVLDKSEYLDVTDYELEYEVDNYDEGRVEFRQLLQSYGIDYQEPDNKVKRFFDRKELLTHKY
ncbi:CYTH domain-containing protein [Staphylococcus sp. SQ8-PEA]|uniref:CYTH domain-containing protein n=1 Tax=Staphylococcus marylandisciuri TaxID=2981529 RepID=A0ABT2QPT9_9STAP|nr:CYTH domain-containing protein [Staphylococcus marylandisciuri]MCU5745994.1 CYTH domain-containing protein [Staphylococcus marylandisciuri]